MLITILATLFVFGLIVLVHEWGHYIAAKSTGMRVDEFAIGFGPKIWSKQVGETLYSLRIIPLGGFNSIAGMTEADAEENHVPRERAFIYRSIPARLLVLVAGAAMNFVLAVVILFGVFSVQGVTEPNPAPVIGQVLPNAPVSSQQLQAGDRIISIDGKSVRQWTDISPLVQQASGDSLQVEVARADGHLNLEIQPTKEGERKVLGITPQILQRQVSVTEAMSYSVQRSYQMLKQMWLGLAGIVAGKQSAGQLAGPVGIAQMAGAVAETGFINLLLFTAMLSLNLGLINLLPVPLLDGGRVLLTLIEGIIGRRIPEKAENVIQFTGLVLLAAVFLWATGNDILRFLR